jgi:hypothetical protein
VRKGKVVRPGRKRRAGGWVLLGLGVLIAGVWVASKWCRVSADISTQASKTSIFISGGRLTLLRYADRVYFHIRADLDLYHRLWEWWSWDFEIGSNSQAVALSLWPVSLLLLSTGGLLSRWGVAAPRRTSGNECAACGYDIAVLSDGAKCPECGKGSGAA